MIRWLVVGTTQYLQRGDRIALNISQAERHLSETWGRYVLARYVGSSEGIPR